MERELPEVPTAEWFAARDAEMRAEIAADREHAQSPAGRLAWAQKYVAFAAYEPMLANAAKLAHAESIIAEAHAREQAELAEREAVWTRETTMARRAEWNARVKRGEFTARPGKPTVVQVAAAERTQGWTLAELKTAIAKHNL